MTKQWRTHNNGNVDQWVKDKRIIPLQTRSPHTGHMPHTFTRAFTRAAKCTIIKRPFSVFIGEGQRFTRAELMRPSRPYGTHTPLDSTSKQSTYFFTSLSMHRNVRSKSKNRSINSGKRWRRRIRAGVQKFFNHQQEHEPQVVVLGSTVFVFVETGNVHHRRHNTPKRPHHSSNK